MIELLSGLPEGVLGLRASGQVTGDDYEQVVIPAVEAALRKRPRLCLVYHFGEAFSGFDAAAMWDDAKVGLRHFTAWDRIAVVTDVDWLRTSAKAFGFVIPGHVRVFSNDRLVEAQEWAATPSVAALKCEILPDQGVAVLTPKGPLSPADFERVSAKLNPFIEARGSLNGLLISTPSFPGWDSFAGLISHLRFVREHHKEIRRVAFVSDSTVLAHLPSIARHFVAADVRHFPFAQKDLALNWLGEPRA